MATQDSRIKIKRSTVTATVPTVPSSNDHTDGTWIATDIYKGELFFNQADDTIWTRGDNGVVCMSGYAELDVTSAQVLTGSSSPVAFGLTVPSGYAIDIVGGSVTIDYGTTPYATNMNVSVRTVGSTDSQLVSPDALNATQSCTRKMAINANFTATDTQLINGADLEFYVDSGDPTAGDSDIKIRVYYRLIPV